MEERAEQPRTIELNDGTRMPLLGLGTWKPEVAFHFYNGLILTTYIYDKFRSIWKLFYIEMTLR